ncbi:hypothetical protein QFC24_006189 [Naganishia onofrii]|uniref:Uncharacterized protein n=1 Tax=Naganishia onofrii TaxID=1851511 RepID=A0ACC2X5M8_9TREE|nr:hypothetical protein QFC24_006189 [Naganishia onofrii]
MPIASPRQFRIVIVGGGIAGLASAIALRGTDREIIILEASRMNKEVGAAISVDLHESLKRLATDPSPPGNPATIRVASKVLSCDCDSGVVTLENGETIQGDLVIGADGIHSKIRASVVGKEMTASPTGLSAYRLIIPKEQLLTIPHVSAMMTDEYPWSTMLLGRDCRVVMGPCRNQELLSIVALVPDTSSSWTAQGSLEDLLKSFDDFPPWIKDTFKNVCSQSMSRYQSMAITRHGKQPLSFLHLLHVKYLPPSHSLTPSIPLFSTAQEALPTWYKGRTILIGDAAHSMLPLQGQGASQSIEDAEALGHFFRDIHVGTSGPAVPVAMEDVTRRLEQVFEARYERASLIQQYSRQAGKPATEAGSNVITMYVCHDYHRWQPTSLLEHFTDCQNRSRLVGTQPSSWTTIVDIPAQKLG